MSIKMEFEGEQADVELGEQDTLVKSMKVAATKQFDLYMEDYEFRVGGRLVLNPEEFDPENDVFVIVKKSEQLDFKAMIDWLRTKGNDYYQFVAENVKSPEFKEAVAVFVSEIQGLIKQLLAALLQSAQAQNLEDLVSELNAATKMFGVPADQFNVQILRNMLDSLQKYVE